MRQPEAFRVWVAQHVRRNSGRSCMSSRTKSGIKVVWIDSEARRRRQALSVLSELGYEASAIASLEQFIGQADVVMIDSVMAAVEPGMVAQLRKQGHGVFSFASRAYLDSEGFDGALEVPLKKELVSRAIDAFLAGHAPSPATQNTARVPDSGEAAIALKGKILGTGALLKRICDISRARISGVLHIKSEGYESQIAFVGGVVVGATDSSTKSRLLARMISNGAISEKDARRALDLSTKLNRRVAELVVELGVCSSARVVEELVGQAEDRVSASICRPSGAFEFVADSGAAERLTAGFLDLHRIAMTTSVRLSGVSHIENMIERRGAAPLARGPDFANSLAAHRQIYGEVAWLSTLEKASSLPTFAEIESIVPAQDLPHARAAFYAFLCLGGIIRRGTRAAKAIPRVQAHIGESDENLVERDLIKREWLRVQGRDLFEVMRLSPTTDTDEIAIALINLNAAYGRARFAKVSLGGAQKEADDVWAIYDEIERLLGDEDALAEYVSSIVADRETLNIEEVDFVVDYFDVETRLREGRRALENAEVALAAQLLGELQRATPADDEVHALWLWSRFLNSEDVASNEVKKALFTICALEKERGEFESARSHLLAALRCFPGEAGFQEALDELGVRAPVIEMGLDEAGFDAAQIAELMGGDQEEEPSEDAFKIEF